MFLNSDTLVNVGKKIESLRLRRGMSQGELAKLIKTSQNTIHKIESGETKRSGFIPAIAAALGCQTEELLSSAQPREPKISPYQAKLIRKIENADEEDLAEIELAINAVLKISKLKRIAGGN